MGRRRNFAKRGRAELFFMSAICRFDQIGPDDGPSVGAKGLNLALLSRAGFPVPPGFCITTTAYRRWRDQPLQTATAFTVPLAEAYQQLGGGPVAVRSSATLEDRATTSFAGQLDTFLGVTGARALVDAVGRCWASLCSDRVRAYCRQHGISEEERAMAVVVQQLVPAIVAGVLFTRNPLDPGRAQMLVEAAWGLGESVVSSRVTPDRYRLDWETGAVLEQYISPKATRRTLEGWQAVPAPQQDHPCLDPARLAELAELGRRVEQFYGAPRDVEWAWAEGRFWLLQARPITTLTDEREQVRREEIAALRARAEPGGTVWSRHNLAEILPEPTPMTWSIVRHLLSSRGGLGLMYRDLGFDPDPALDEDGIFDLICGRPYCNLSREPRLQFHELPLRHPFAALKAAPERAVYPQPVFQPAQVGLRFWLRLPVVTVQLLRASYRVQRYYRSFPRHFREIVAPAFVAAATEEAACDLRELSPGQLLERLEGWMQRTLYDFARDSLKPAALAGIALGNLERLLRPALGPDRTRAALVELSLGAHSDPE
ncbi:MAG: hypothetical protein L0Z62_16415, partial [Gemmataceae bacterium]|nr:hypothetical protein [Gemmataceae bacterium]